MVSPLTENFERWQVEQEKKTEKKASRKRQRENAEALRLFRLQNDRRIAESWRDVRPGTRLGNITVARKNRYSVVTEFGTRYSIDDLYGYRIAKLIRELEVRHD